MTLRARWLNDLGKELLQTSWTSSKPEPSRPPVTVPRVSAAGLV